MKNRIITITIIVAIIAAVTILVYTIAANKYSIPVKTDMNVCSLSGDTETISLDFTIENNLIDPLHYKGKVIWQGITHIDYYSRFFSPERKSIFFRLNERFKLSGFDLSPDYIAFTHRTFYDESARWRAEIGHQVKLDLIYYNGERYLNVFDYGTDIEYYGPAENAAEAQAVADIITEFYLSNMTE